jgi:hypothetical protein
MDDWDEANPQTGFGCSLVGRSRRGVVRAACFFVSFLVAFFGSSVNVACTMLFSATSGAGSVAAGFASVSNGIEAGGTQGEFT